MSTYSYKATDPAGKLVTGTLEAAEEKEAVASLQSMRYIPIRISLAKRNRIGPDIDLSKRVRFFFQEGFHQGCRGLYTGSFHVAGSRSSGGSGTVHIDRCCGKG